MREGNSIITDLYVKPTDTLTYLVNLVLIGSVNDSSVHESVLSEQKDEEHVGGRASKESDKSNIDFSNIETSAEKIDDRYMGKFVSPNVINLFGRKLTKAEISFLSKGLKFVPTPNDVSRAVLKEELETLGRRLKLIWFFRNEESTVNYDPFRLKSTFNPRAKDAAIEIYFSRLKKRS